MTVSRNLAAALLPGLAALLISFATFGFASSIDPGAQERQVTAEKFVAQSLRTWQERLNLSDWNIRADLVGSEKLEPRTLGNIHWDMNVKTARISVLSPRDYKLPQREMLDDMEFTIVHELVHLQLASLPRSDASRREEEHAVNELARALLRLAKR